MSERVGANGCSGLTACFALSCFCMACEFILKIHVFFKTSHRYYISTCDHLVVPCSETKP